MAFTCNDDELNGKGNLFVDIPQCKYFVFDCCYRECQEPEVCEHCLRKAREIIDAGYRQLCRENRSFFSKRLLNDINKRKEGDVDG